MERWFWKWSEQRCSSKGREYNRGVDTETIISYLKAFGQAHPEIVAIYLFGSYANGTARPTSDIDVAVLFTTEVSDVLQAELDLDSEIGALPGLAKVEVAALNRVSLQLRAEVLETGRRVHCNDEEARTTFEYETMRQWWDMQAWHETYNREYFAAVKERFTDEQRRAYQRARQTLAATP